MSAAGADLDGVCDCHMHVYEDTYPLAPTATFKPPHAPVTAYREVQRTLGLTHAVVVQPTAYGFDNRCTLAAVAALGSNARGIAVVPDDVSDAELDRLHAAGVRGLRFMMLPGGLARWSALEGIAARIAAWGWHINLQCDGRELPLYQAMLRRLATPLVIDHIGKFLGPTTPDSAAFLALRRLLDGGRCWVKLSAPYESSRVGPPGYDDVAVLTRVLAAQHTQRCLWASNWPHPNREPTPSNTALLGWALDVFGDVAARRAILIDNPRALYGF